MHPGRLSRKTPANSTSLPPPASRSTTAIHTPPPACCCRHAIVVPQHLTHAPPTNSCRAISSSTTPTLPPHRGQEPRHNNLLFLCGSWVATRIRLRPRHLLRLLALTLVVLPLALILSGCTTIVFPYNPPPSAAPRNLHPLDHRYGHDHRHLPRCPDDTHRHAIRHPKFL